MQVNLVSLFIIEFSWTIIQEGSLTYQNTFVIFLVIILRFFKLIIFEKYPYNRVLINVFLSKFSIAYNYSPSEITRSLRFCVQNS